MNILLKSHTSNTCACAILLLLPLVAHSQVPSAWWYSNAGRNEKILPPWTAIRVHEDTAGAQRNIELSVWGRTYAFANTPFPARIVTAGRQILASPIELAGVGSNGPLGVCPSNTFS